MLYPLRKVDQSDTSSSFVDKLGNPRNNNKSTIKPLYDQTTFKTHWMLLGDDNSPNKE